MARTDRKMTTRNDEEARSIISRLIQVRWTHRVAVARRPRLTQGERTPVNRI